MDAYFAEAMARLQGLVDTYGAERLTIAGAIVLILALLVVRRLRRRQGGRVASASPDRDYAKLEDLDIPEHERLRRVIAERAGWRELPERLLSEFSTRLRSKDNVLQFIAVAEAHRLLKGTLSGLDGADIDADMKAVAAGFAELAAKQPEAAEAALRIAARIDPDNFHVVLALAGDHYRAGRFQEALPLLERGIPICREAVENPGATSPGRQGGVGQDLRQLLQKSMELYESCLEQDASA